MSSLFKQAMGVSAPVGPVMSLESAAAIFMQDQMELAEEEHSLEMQQTTIQALEDGLVSLESIYHAMETKVNNGGSIDEASLESCRAIVTHLFGEDVLYNNASLESMSDADQLTLEGLRGLISTVGRKLRGMYDGAQENISWLQSRFMGGFKKSDQFLKSADRSIKSIDARAEQPSTVSVSKRVAGNLHVNGSMDPKVIADSLSQLAAMNNKVFSNIPGGVNELSKASNDFANKIIADITKGSSGKDVDAAAKGYMDDLLKLAKGIQSKTFGPYIKADKTELPGGRVLNIDTSEDVYAVKLENSSAKVPTDTPVATPAELTQIHNSLNNLLSMNMEFQKPTDAISAAIEELVVASNEINESDRLSIESDLDGDLDKWKELHLTFIKTYIKWILITIFTFGLASPFAIYYILKDQIPAIISSFKLVINFFLGNYKEKDDQSTESLTIERRKTSDKFTQKIVNSISSTMVNTLRYQNNIVKSGNLYLKAHLDAYGVDGSEPEALDD